MSDQTIKINREMLREAVIQCIARTGISLEDMPRELELELFGSIAELSKQNAEKEER